ncbi:hypothetical protein UFOVP380_46 [uncultured Caudovirales phage]|uniref:Uncharacterized protein n=1 Tax=uncultured Caudovirales phage TaxID=2100421 RepID=A0A6J7X323_9CAUD|nr:hypothetical protein UFOVP380_46 [uncultured Caudovirales phage]
MSDANLHFPVAEVATSDLSTSGEYLAGVRQGKAATKADVLIIIAYNEALAYLEDNSGFSLLLKKALAYTAAQHVLSAIDNSLEKQVERMYNTVIHDLGQAAIAAGGWELEEFRQFDLPNDEIDALVGLAATKAFEPTALTAHWLTTAWEV